ncbi:hypothetical protein E6C76_09480 [Pseudothauera nasutitermitis]|uniref:Dicarboxylate transport domain-containing protein n=1 Tax=Pseudothauera nasutitermitis TaxID=2565930 RepID=A0A4S4B0G4_9RHOO|nr:hypothetical protein E6C76_09480 [Pseudothauera nasutitermitis]
MAALALLSAAGGAAARALVLDFERLEHPAFVVHDLELTLEEGGAAARLRIGALEAGGRRIEGLRLQCPRFRLDADQLQCAGGRLDVAGLSGVAVELDARLAARSGTLRLELGDGEALRLNAAADGVLRAELRGVEVARLGALAPLLAGWQPAGRIDGQVEHRGARAAGRSRFDLNWREGGFSSTDGLQAAEGIALRLHGQVDGRAGGWDWQAALEWSAGEAYLHPLYLTAGPRAQLRGRLAGERLRIDEATLELDGVERVAGQGEYDLAAGRLHSGGFGIARADLAVVGPRYLAPLLAPAQAEGLRFAGHVSAGLRVEDGRLAELDAAFEQAGIGLEGGELAFGPVDGALPWRAEQATEAVLSVGGGRWQKLALGAFDLHARLHGPQVAVERVRIPLLDGALVFDDLHLRHGADGWHGSGGAVVEPISMPLLTEAVGLPPMAGVLSASLPGMQVSPGEIVLDGALVISVFGGYLQATELRVLEPFGVASHLYADIDARNLDLAQLTDTFSFGSISGQVDVGLRGLELARWKPVRFDARVASSPGRYPRRISQRAVQNIGALGGAGAVAAIQRSLLGFFESFGYREIGISCVLRDGVCLMGGLEGAGGAGGGYALVRGGGIPALNVIGYNRRVDWFELVDRLQRVTESNASPVVR